MRPIRIGIDSVIMKTHRCSKIVPTLVSIGTSAAAILIGAGATLGAEPYVLSGTEVHPLPPSSNGRSYTLYVAPPGSYQANPTRRYPVVYMLDGYWTFALTSAEAGSLAVDRVIPECFVVGIAYSGVNPDVGTLRQYDFTYPPYGSNTGGGRAFLTVIAEEFIPYIESHFRVDPSFRVLAGASGGGLFTVYAMWTEPELFQAYIAVSPGDLRYANYHCFQLEQAYARTHSALPGRLFLSYATDEIYTMIRPVTRDFYAQLNRSGYTPHSYTMFEITGEGHSGTGAEAFNRGLRYAFAERAPVPYTGVDPGFSIRSTLINISTRGYVGSGEAALIAGFVIDGVEPKRVLVRAAGPALGPQGVARFLPDPRLRVTRLQGTDLAVNDNWGDGPNAGAVATASAQVGAFGFANGSRDAATVVTLEPGLYTVIVDSATTAEGVALAEVYELRP